MSTEVVTAELWPCSAEEYHKDHKRIGHGMLEDFRQSPRLYEGLYETHTIPIPPSTGPQVFGQAFHKCALEPDRSACDVAVAPDVNKRKKAEREELEVFNAENADKIVVTHAEMHKIAALTDALYANPNARRLLESDGPIEQAMWWVDEETGLHLKCRRDKVIGDVIVDLKTAIAPAPKDFAKACANYGYHRQAAYYVAGQKALSGGCRGFVFVVVGKEPPHEVGVYELDVNALDLGRRQNRRALVELMACRETKEWAAEWEQRPLSLSLPGWAEMADAWEVES
jgi:hypothetical protein